MGNVYKSHRRKLIKAKPNISSISTHCPNYMTFSGKLCPVYPQCIGRTGLLYFMESKECFQAKYLFRPLWKFIFILFTFNSAINLSTIVDCFEKVIFPLGVDLHPHCTLGQDYSPLQIVLVRFSGQLLRLRKYRTLA